jgi:hypothetical protein
VSKLGVSLGESQSAIFNTVDSINKKDSKRTLVMLSKKLEEKILDQVDENPIILTQANNLSCDLDNEYIGDSDDCLNLTLAEIKKNIIIKKKVSIKKPVARRSARLKKKSKSS